MKNEELLNVIKKKDNIIKEMKLIIEEIDSPKINEKISTLVKNNLEDNSPEYIVFSKPKSNNKFLNIVGTMLSNISPKIGFKSSDNRWENLGYKVSFKITRKIKNITVKSIADEFKKIKNISVISNTNSFNLIGEKKIIEKISKKYQKNLKLLGFEVEDLNDKDNNYQMSAEDITKLMNEKIEKDFNFSFSSMSFNILNNLDDNKKVELIEKIIWPKLSNELNDVMNLSIDLNKLTEKKEKLKDLFDFAKLNSIHADVVVHTLKNNSELLQNLHGYEKVLKSKDDILSLYDKYENLIYNNILVLKSLTDTSNLLKENLKSMNLPSANKLIEKIDSSIIAYKDKKTYYTFSIIEKNINQIIDTKKLKIN